jgi:antitoxin component YwqK of YwqJK toxin-antitoxin module
MKSLLVFILVSLFTISAYSQDTINRTNSKGLKEGFWRKLDTSGKKVYEGRFSNGIPTGTFHYYYPSGVVKAISEFSHNGKRSKTVTFFPSGKKMAEGIYMEEKRDSIWQFFSDYDGVLLSEETYKDGKKDGPSKTYYPGKGPAEIINWVAGVREGQWIQYFTDGTVKMRLTNKNGKKNGPMEVLSENGIVIISGRYLNGDPDGTWLYYDDKGKPTKKEVYDKGAIVSSEEIKN